MDKELTAIHSKQTAKVLAFLTFLSLLIILVPVAIIMFAATTGGKEGSKFITMGAIYLVMLIIYLPLMYILIRLYCWIYNKVAQKFGGIRFTLEDLS